MIIAMVLFGLIVLSFLFSVSIYNLLIAMRQNVKNGWSQIDVQLKRRHDLIPNLVETAKGYMAHEKQTLENVIKARQQAVDASGLKDKQQAENFLSSTLKSLFAVVENYPNLKADQHMLKVQEELTTTENKIAFARQYYNDEVARFNTAVQTFPNNVIAGLFHFTKEDFFEIVNPAEKEAPQVKF
ncbi:MAG TPA: LemA family protein [Candidatus Omnitrophota bacterium]|nr:LemA family protein [Candidatus Omnitrophota bacterium]HQL41700.1 LemA family protein [Candidatus Omnitrophota bacterium]